MDDLSKVKRSTWEAFVAMASVERRQWLRAICELCPETEKGVSIGPGYELALARTLPDSWSKVEEQSRCCCLSARIHRPELLVLGTVLHSGT